MCLVGGRAVVSVDFSQAAGTREQGNADRVSFERGNLFAVEYWKHWWNIRHPRGCGSSSRDWSHRKNADLPTIYQSSNIE